jgi:hypothetical protein
MNSIPVLLLIFTLSLLEAGIAYSAFFCVSLCFMLVCVYNHHFALKITMLWILCSFSFPNCDMFYKMVTTNCVSTVEFLNVLSAIL